MTKRAGFLVLLFALFSGLIASAAVMKYVRNINEQKLIVPQTAPVVVSKVSIPAGGVILDSQIEVVQRPITDIPSSSIKTIKSAEGRIVRTTIFPGEVIMDERLVKPGSLGGLPSLIPTGMRAITLKVDETTSVSGFVRPGHFVDILTTIDVAGGEKTITKTILQNIRVIATGHEIENGHEDKKVKVIPTITVLATLEQSERIALATNAGSIRLVLRNHEDVEEVITEGVSLSSLIPQANHDIELSPPVLVEAFDEPVPQSIPNNVRVVEVYRGTQKTEVTFSN